jgi:hypothetical protein
VRSVSARSRKCRGCGGVGYGLVRKTCTDRENMPAYNYVIDWDTRLCVPMVSVVLCTEYSGLILGGYG